jgi:Fic family protein
LSIAITSALGFVLPFVDGNGRTARAIFYWYMPKSGYRLFEYLLISRIICNAPIRHGKAYLNTETDGGDLTYFNHYHLSIVVRAIDDLHEYLERLQRHGMRRAVSWSNTPT